MVGYVAPFSVTNMYHSLLWTNISYQKEEKREGGYSKNNGPEQKETSAKKQRTKCSMDDSDGDDEVMGDDFEANDSGSKEFTDWGVELLKMHAAETQRERQARRDEATKIGC